MLIADYFAKRLGKTPVNVHRRCRRTVLLCGYVAGARAGSVIGTAVAERDLHRHSWRDWHALFFGISCRAERVQPPRCIPIPFASAGSLPVGLAGNRRRNLELSCGLLVCVSYDCRHHVLRRIKDV